MAYGWFGCLKWKWKYSKLACCSSLVRISSLSDSFVICHIVWPEILSALIPWGWCTDQHHFQTPRSQTARTFVWTILLFVVQNPLLLWSGEGAIFEFRILWSTLYRLTRSLNIPAAMASQTNFLASSSWKIKLTQLALHLSK